MARDAHANGCSRLPPCCPHSASPLACDVRLGTGEVIHVLSYKAMEGKVDAFEFVVQGLARCLYSCEASVTDVRGELRPGAGAVLSSTTY